MAIKKQNLQSLGIVDEHRFFKKDGIKFASGDTLAEYTLVYETYGHLNSKKNNAILVCHALSGNQHAAGFRSKNDKYPGWWDNHIGPGKAIDTNKFFIVCPNNLGGCHGSTGPNSINSKTGKVYGPTFPIPTCKDWINTHKDLMQHLGISKWHAVVGGSLGGMQALQWSIDYPSLLTKAVVIAAAPKLSAQNIAFNEIARQAIIRDPEFHQGYFLEKKTIPKQGLALARMLGHITYLSNDLMRRKFGRELKKTSTNYNFEVEFEVESYLRYQGSKFAEESKFDANTYLLMTKSLDYFDPAKDYGDDLHKALAMVETKFLVISFSSDWRFAPECSMEIVTSLLANKKQVSYAMIESHEGHDAFLLPNKKYSRILKTFLKN